jgi:uncharacterized protein YkwD
MSTLSRNAGAADRPVSRRARRSVLPAVVALVVAATVAPAPARASACPGAEAAPTAAGLAAFAESTLCLVNEQRVANGLVALTRNAALDGASVTYSRAMVSESFFAHVAPDGTDLVARLKRTSYMPAASDWTVGENLGWGTGAMSTPGQLTAAWMASPGHRANILRTVYREIGIGVALGSPSASATGVTVTTDFGAIVPGRCRGANTASRRAVRRCARGRSDRTSPARRQRAGRNGAG